MYGELERMWKEDVVTYLKVLVKVCLEGQSKPTETSNRNADFPAENRTWDLQKTRHLTATFHEKYLRLESDGTCSECFIISDLERVSYNVYFRKQISER